MSEKIKALIPHRYPFLFVDEILTANKDETVALKIFHSGEIMGNFSESNFVPGTLIFESMAQAGGAGVKQVGLTDGIFAFATINEAQILNPVVCGEQIKMIIKNIRVSNKIISQLGTAFVKGKVVAKAKWLCVRIG
ncbi:3-hydroxyacyl-ACP dehydratase FabZ family protein [Flavivirga jejuensis]|uniref:Beta-hydroxyacyl-ACP dehydratase n=1 Tax=Flavivirga jejuensis TaxID=870487 RepID=A0ABT8WVM9_9FLAO|nr:beta-hydroxyacyl-ACP dehydratase [Flavivirga jejuensis]MDO5976932.1 beta-hydroxyacyl-ACP dehydratase [Flavivirga jejuensis]